MKEAVMKRTSKVIKPMRTYLWAHKVIKTVCSEKRIKI